MDRIERNKENVVAFCDLMFNQCQPREAIERYAGAEYIQHNPESPTASRVSSIISKMPRATIPASASSSSA